MRPGTSVRSFFSAFPDEEACLQRIFDAKFADAVCPRCGEAGSWRRIGGTMKWRHSCGKHISPRENTLCYRSNLSLMAWFYALLLFADGSRGPTTGFLSRQLGLGSRSAHRVALAIRKHIAAFERPAKLGGVGKRVVADELRIGHIQPGRETADTQIIVFACASEGKILSSIIPDRRSVTLRTALTKFVHPESILVTDALSAYLAPGSDFAGHIIVNHRRAFSDFRGNTTNEVETFFATAKRHFRAYRKVKAANAWLFLAEIEYFYNRRHSTTPLFDELIGKFPDVAGESFLLVRDTFHVESQD